MEGVGSIWNKNSWHWEEKNYTEKAKQFLTDNLLNIKVEGFTPRASEIIISKVSEIKGSAVITIRKKKQLYIYDFEIECEWEAHEREGDEEAKGTLKVKEFHQDDDPEDIEIDVSPAKSDEYHDTVKQVIRKQMLKEIASVAEQYKELMKRIDADEKKIREDQEKRMREEEEMKKAELDKGIEKQAIFEAAKKKDEEMKQKEHASKQIPIETQANKGTGSVWNPNSYFWEEKNWSKWSKEKINEYLGNFKHTVEGGNLEVTDCEVEGDANNDQSSSIRKGKKIYAFDFVITLKWTISLKEGEEETKMTGEFKFPEVSNAVVDDDEEIRIDLEYKTGIEHRDKVNSHIKGAIFTALKKNLDKYVSEFKSQGS